MPERAQQVLDEALSLSAAERALLVEELLASLDRPDPDLDEQWAEEVEDRIDAFDRGAMKALPAEDVIGDRDEQP